MSNVRQFQELGKVTKLYWLHNGIYAWTSKNIVHGWIESTKDFRLLLCNIAQGDDCHQLLLIAEKSAFGNVEIIKWNDITLRTSPQPPI